MSYIMTARGWVMLTPRHNDIGQPARVPPLKASAINPENIPEIDPNDYNLDGRFMGDPSARIKAQLRELGMLNAEEREARIERRGHDKFIYVYAFNKRRDKYGVAIMT